jgi:hypothetical protein
MKATIVKRKNYDFGGGVKRDTYFINVWDKKYGWNELVYQTLGGFTKDEAIETKEYILKNIKKSFKKY